MIAVNQVGYVVGSVKHATISGGKHYKLYNSKGERVLEGDVKPVFDENSAEEAGCIDFSEVNTPGKYYFVDEKGERSNSFTIGKKVYASLFKDALRMYYFQRCGMALEEKYAGRFAHKACHCTNARILYSDPIKRIKLKGGWHDAGDYGRYVTAGAVALAHLLYAYSLKPKAFKISFDIPESGNGMPDILNECAWELDWMLKMQEKDGGVHHKVTSESFVGFVMPEEDKLEPVVTPVSSLATADQAAIMALAARLYEEYDEKRAAAYKKSALAAGKWLIKNQEFIFKNPSEIRTGTYEDMCDADERMWAAVELYQLTGDEKWIWSVRQILELRISTVALGWADVGGIAAMSMLMAKKGVFPQDLVERLKGNWLEEADRLSKVAAGNPYELAFHKYNFNWGSNMQVLCNAMVLCFANKLSGKEDYLKYAASQLDYILGRNAMDISYVTGYGEKAFRDPHNRPTVADGIDDPIPGYVSGGPNYRACDTAANPEILKGRPPMKWFVDDWKSYSTNEITIYWNSPLIYVLAYLTGGK